MFLAKSLTSFLNQLYLVVVHLQPPLQLSTTTWPASSQTPAACKKPIHLFHKRLVALSLGNVFDRKSAAAIWITAVASSNGRITDEGEHDLRLLYASSANTEHIAVPIETSPVVSDSWLLFTSLLGCSGGVLPQSLSITERSEKSGMFVRMWMVVVRHLER